MAETLSLHHLFTCVLEGATRSMLVGDVSVRSQEKKLEGGEKRQPGFPAGPVVGGQLCGEHHSKQTRRESCYLSANIMSLPDQTGLHKTVVIFPCVVPCFVYAWLFDWTITFKYDGCHYQEIFNLLQMMLHVWRGEQGHGRLEWEHLS